MASPVLCGFNTRRWNLAASAFHTDGAVRSQAQSAASKLTNRLAVIASSILFLSPWKLGHSMSTHASSDYDNDTTRRNEKHPPPKKKKTQEMNKRKSGEKKNVRIDRVLERDTEGLDFGGEEEYRERKMSVASSIPCIKIPNPAATLSSASPSSSSTPTSSCLRLSGAAAIKPFAVTIRSSQAEGPSRRPAASPLREPSPPAPPTPLKPIPPSSPSSPVVPPSPSKPAAQVALVDKNIITLEFQRRKAKELQDYFKQKKLEEADQGPFFGFIGKNEIINGRWAMFGFAVGLLTEYATGSDFVDQVKILMSNFGIIDLE